MLALLQQTLFRNPVFSNLVFEVPPLPEQHAIAKVLSDVDGLINALDTLIAKKQAIKRAVMQQLLTGRMRLPGFSGEWIEKPLVDLATVTMGAIAVLAVL